MPALAAAGGVIGWVVIGWLVTIATPWVAVPVAIVLLVLSLFIITKTPPNKLGRRLHELYAYLFGAPAPAAEPEEAVAEPPAPGAKTSKRGKKGDTDFQLFDDLGFDEDRAAADGDETEGGTVPWWRRNKSGREEDPAYDSPVITGATSTVPDVPASAAANPNAGAAAGLIDHTPAEPASVNLNDSVEQDLEQAEQALRDFGAEVPAAPATSGRPSRSVPWRPRWSVRTRPCPRWSPRPSRPTTSPRPPRPPTTVSRPWPLPTRTRPRPTACRPRPP
jgi:S-DNA-T family DNA segregation ATPase FtsK/SpoIIIE